MANNGHLISLLPVITKNFSCGGQSERKLPFGEKNLFSRIIKNPLDTEKPARETRCVQLLCFLLENVYEFRKRFLNFLADKSGFNKELINDYNWYFETEKYIEGKRIDLCVEGHNREDGVKVGDVLWIIEAKVSAGFHNRTINHYQDLECDDISCEEQEIDHQILFYDKWLHNQPEKHKAGFVLSARNMQSDMPDKLKEPWYLTTWANFSEFIKDLEFSSEHNFVINHYKGFSKEYLERGANMELTFEKIAFLKAYWEIGEECGETLDYLVSPIKKLLEESSLGLKNIKKQQLYGKPKRCVYSSTLYKNGNDEIWLLAGVDEDLWVWIESKPNLKGKQALTKSFEEVLGGFKIDSYVWDGSDEDDWLHIGISAPLTELLNKNDQRRVVTDFVSIALKQLEEVKVVDIIKKSF